MQVKDVKVGDSFYSHEFKDIARVITVYDDHFIYTWDDYPVTFIGKDEDTFDTLIKIRNDKHLLLLRLLDG